MMQNEVISKHQEILSALHNVIEETNKVKEEIVAVSEELILDSVLSIVGVYPVDDLLNDGCEAADIEVLKKCDINTIADLIRAEHFELAEIFNGDENKIKSILARARYYKATAETHVRIEINPEYKNESSTKLVVLLSRFLGLDRAAYEANKLLNMYEEGVLRGIEYMEPYSTKFKWTFASGEVKAKAESCYKLLEEMLRGKYIATCEIALDHFAKANNVSPGDAWEQYCTSSGKFNNALAFINPKAIGQRDKVDNLPEKEASGVREEDILSPGLRISTEDSDELGVKFILHQKKVFLGEGHSEDKMDMIIATIVSRSNSGETHFVVACPDEKLIEWTDRITEHSELPVIRVQGELGVEAIKTWAIGGGVAVVSYDSIQGFKLSEDSALDMIVVDQVEQLSMSEEVYKAVLSIIAHTERAVFVSELPFEENVDLIGAFINILDPSIEGELNAVSYLDNQSEFMDKIAGVYYSCGKLL